jgi:hypothetical protein
LQTHLKIQLSPLIYEYLKKLMNLSYRDSNNARHVISLTSKSNTNLKCAMNATKRRRPSRADCLEEENTEEAKARF